MRDVLPHPFGLCIIHTTTRATLLAHFLLFPTSLHSQELGKLAPVAAKVKAPPKKSADELKAMLPAIISAEVALQQGQWKDLKDSGTVTKFGSAMLRTFPVSLQMLEQRAGLTPDSLGMDESEVTLDDFK